MHRLLPFLFLCFTGLGYAQTTVLEDFEGDSDITWEAINGTYNGVVANPEDSTGANSSANVGSYTKSGENAYSLFVGTLADSLDLTTNSRFTIQVNAGAATSFIMKLEGAGTPVEMTKNIATPNVWRTYTFDFSSVATTLRAGRVILFFDPGVEASADTYLFDNLTVRPAGPCAGTVADATVIDDFECQRNATYEAGFDSLMVIANPDKSGINTSDSVGRYTDENTAFAALVIDYNAALNLSVNNRICMKVWAPVTGNLLVKLQGGSSAAVERPVAVTETETWVEVCVDFSDQSAANHEQLVFFFNAGVDGTAGDIYYIDDITITPAPPQEAIEDFEDGASLNWGPANDNAALNGTFTVIANPDTEGNESENVGSYVRGTANFATLTAALPDGLDLSGNPQLNLDVWAPAANTVVTLQLTSATVAGPIIATATVTEASSWQTLSFNFADFAAVTDFDRINLRFAPGTTGTGTYYFDNLVQGQGTVEACLDVEPDPSILDDFECQRNVTYTTGSEFLSVVDNPNGGPGSPNPSSRVGAFRDQPGAFNSLVIDFDSAGLDLSLRNQLSATVRSPSAGQLLFKLEGGTAVDIERYVAIDTTNAWSTYTVDFSDAVDGGYTRLVLFFGAGENNTAEATYYIDDLRLTRAAYVSSCVVNFEEEDLTLSDWSYFANGSLTDADFMIVDNPDTTGINTSARVGVFEEAADGDETFAGLFTTLEAPVALPTDNKVVTMKVWMPVATTVVFKLEQGDMDPAGTTDITADYTTPNAWQELTFNLSETPDSARYDQITLILNNQEIPATDQTYYFDDIAVGGGDCSNITSIFEPITVEGIRVYPNPITDRLTIENPLGATRFTLTSMLGQQLQQLNVSGARTQVQWELNDLPTGTYLLTAQDRSGQLVARSMVVKR